MVAHLRCPYGLVLVLLLSLSACGTHYDYAELKADDCTFGQVWDAVDQVASSDGFRSDGAACDRGLGIYQTRWHRRTLMMGRSGRRRLRAELEQDPSGEKSVMVRFYVEMAQVPDLSLGAPEEDDWEESGQDGAYQQLFARRLAAVLGLVGAPKAEEPLRFRRDGS